jgi:WD40 repeat protein
MALYPDNSLLVVGGYCHVAIYDIKTNEPNPIFVLKDVNKNVVSIGFNNKGTWMFTGGEDKTLKIWDMK